MELKLVHKNIKNSVTIEDLDPDAHYICASFGTQSPAVLTRCSYGSGLFRWRAIGAICNGNGFGSEYKTVADAVDGAITISADVVVFTMPQEMLQWLSKEMGE